MKIKLQLEQAEAQEVINALMQRAQGIAALAANIATLSNEQLKPQPEVEQRADE